jgi:hypothetical protein
VRVAGDRIFKGGTNGVWLCGDVKKTIGVSFSYERLNRPFRADVSLGLEPRARSCVALPWARVESARWAFEISTRSMGAVARMNTAAGLRVQRL